MTIPAIVSVQAQVHDMWAGVVSLETMIPALSTALERFQGGRIYEHTRAEIKALVWGWVRVGQARRILWQYVSGEPHVQIDGNHVTIAWWTNYRVIPLADFLVENKQ